MKLFKKTTAFASISFLYLSVFISNALAQINIEPAPQEGSDSPIVAPGGDLSVNAIVSYIITALGIIAVLAALLWLIIGAIKWIISGGDKEKVAAARSQIIAAIIGLIIVILSFVILNFVVGFISGGNIFDLRLNPLDESIGGEWGAE